MSQDTKNFKVLTYNVFLRPPPIKTNDDDFKHQRLDDILDRIHQFDIVCFQELFQTATFRKEKVIQRAISKGFFYWKECDAPTFWSGAPVDSGLLVISKHPIIESSFESYEVGVLSDSASDKGYIYCKISVFGKILHLFTTHLQASYLHPGMMVERELSIKTRLHQFRTLVNRIRSILTRTRKNPKEEPVLLMGDLNMNALMVPLNLHGSVLQSQKVGKLFFEYDSFMKIFAEANIKATNCVFQKYQYHPITFGDGDTVLTDRLESLSKQSLDFIFQLDISNQALTVSTEQESPKTKNECVSKEVLTTEHGQGKFLRPLISSARVQEFKVKDRPYLQLSDHYGMSIELAIQ